MSAEGGYPNQTGENGVNNAGGNQLLTLNATSLGITDGNTVVLPIPGFTTASIALTSSTTPFPALLSGATQYQTTSFTLPYNCIIIAISIVTASSNTDSNVDLYTAFTASNLIGVSSTATSTTSGNNLIFQITNIFTATGSSGDTATLNVNIASNGIVNTNADAVAGQLAYIIIPTP